MSIIYLIFSLIVLFFSKRWLTERLSFIIHRLGGSRHTLIVFWSLIFLPGTIIHELSHFFFAILTGARTGKIEIFPEYLEEDWEDENNGKVALGYVQTQKLNPVQGFFVGIAPFLSGIVLMTWLGSEIYKNFTTQNYLYLFLEGYLFFTIGNSFFPSWSDIKQTLTLIVVLSIFTIILWVVGFQIVPHFNQSYQNIIFSISLAILISAFLNLLVTLLLFLFGPKKR